MIQAMLPTPILPKMLDYSDKPWFWFRVICSLIVILGIIAYVVYGEHHKKISKKLLNLGLPVVLGMTVAFLFMGLVGNVSVVNGSSMEPTLKENDMVFSSKLELKRHGVTYGDIVVLKDIDGTGRNYIKRVIALQGDKVVIKDGQVFVNDKLLQETYTSQNAYTESHGKTEWVVEKDSVFVLGDNRGKGKSKDSRYFGPVPYDGIIGTVTHKIKPEFEVYK